MELNEKIARAMLMQCALVWEHCTKNANAGKFNLGEVRRGVYGKTANRLKAKPGMVLVDLEHPKWEGVFRMKLGQIDGVTLNWDNSIHLEHGSFSCGYRLIDVFDVADRFCQCNIPWMGNRMEFGCDGEERWANLPDVQQPKAKESKPKAKVVKPQPSDIKPQTSTMDIAERLRQVLLAA